VLSISSQRSREQVLNFGVPTQIDVQLQGKTRGKQGDAALLQQKLANVPAWSTCMFSKS